MPQAMRNEYEQSSLLSRVQAICHSDSDDNTECEVQSGDARSKRLLLIHGLLDDNVHVRHALLLLQVIFSFVFIFIVGAADVHIVCVGFKAFAAIV